MKLKASED